MVKSLNRLKTGGVKTLRLMALKENKAAVKLHGEPNLSIRDDEELSELM